MEVLDLAKAFAGPTATIIAAIAAVSVTYILRSSRCGLRFTCWASCWY